MKFEDKGIAYYSDNDNAFRTLTHPSAEDLKEKINNSSTQWKNPYNDAYIWLKGESLDVIGMYNGIMGRETVIKNQLAAEQRKRDNEKELNKLSEGKTTIKSIFKSKSQKESGI